MATYAKVDIRIWNDNKVKKMTPIPPCGQGLWIHLLVSEHRTSLPGVLKVGEAALAEELGWSVEDFRKAFQEASSLGLVKADWKARFVWIPNACEYNQPESPNVVKSWRIPWDESPECELKNEAYRRLKAFIEGFGEGFKKAFAQSCPEPSPNQEQEQEQQQEQKGKPPVPAPASCSGKLRPNNALNLKTCLLAAIRREQPSAAATCSVGRFADDDAKKFLAEVGTGEVALQDIERKLDLFAKDPDMQPWTMAKFVDKFNSIGLPKLEFGRAPKPATASTSTPIREW